MFQESDLYLDPIPPSPVELDNSVLLDHFQNLALQTSNPRVPQPALLPTVMSFRPANPLEYRNGFKKPMGDKPAFRRASFNKATIAVKVGDEQEVPPMSSASPFQKILKLSPCAETSG